MVPVAGAARGSPPLAPLLHVEVILHHVFAIFDHFDLSLEFLHGGLFGLEKVFYELVVLLDLREVVLEVLFEASQTLVVLDSEDDSFDVFGLEVWVSLVD